jgi:hypothetical protein
MQDCRGTQDQCDKGRWESDFAVTRQCSELWLPRQDVTIVFQHSHKLADFLG